jgi:hypothetical protein
MAGSDDRESERPTRFVRIARTGPLATVERKSVRVLAQVRTPFAVDQPLAHSHVLGRTGHQRADRIRSAARLRASLRHTAFRALMAGGSIYFIGNSRQAMTRSRLVVNCTGSAFLAALVQTGLPAARRSVLQGGGLTPTTCSQPRDGSRRRGPHVQPCRRDGEAHASARRRCTTKGTSPRCED